MNLPILLIAVGAFLSVNHHYGWNGLPASGEELIADLLALLILALAFLKVPA